MAEYASPGVYVEEVASATKPIAGVSTSTAGFIGILTAAQPQPALTPTPAGNVTADYAGVEKTQTFSKSDIPSNNELVLPITPGETIASVSNVKDGNSNIAKSKYTTDTPITKVTLSPPTATNPGPTNDVTVTYLVRGTDVSLVKSSDGNYQLPASVTSDKVTAVKVDGKAAEFDKPAAETGKITLKPTSQPAPTETKMIAGAIANPQQKQVNSDVTDKQPKTIPLTFPTLIGNDKIEVQLVDDANKVTGIIEYDALQIINDLKKQESKLIIANPPKTSKVVVIYRVLPAKSPDVGPGEPVLCTSFSDYKKQFGDFPTDQNQRNLTHAVYGFFNNGGTTCYVTYLNSAKTVDDLRKALDAFERISDISIVVAPGITDDAIRQKIVTHCVKTGDRFAIFDGPSPDTTGANDNDIDKLTKITANGGFMPQSTTFAAWYYPWIKVADPTKKMLNPDTDGTIFVPPSGHIAGVYARVDNTRGVHKAPANEPIFGALDVARKLSNTEQGLLNPKGVNAIRVLNDSILVWGARTVGGDGNADLKYINVRRTLLYLRKSVYEGTQWVVFEPNTPALWQKISRNVNAFLMNVWRSGALFGTTPQQAFYVKCDAETNPPELRELGQVVTEIGVAIARPAEFVIFRISQWAGPGK
jgi:Bacteriophage tail sheath protein